MTGLTPKNYSDKQSSNTQWYILMFQYIKYCNIVQKVVNDRNNTNESILLNSPVTNADTF
jgi:hypothetical protein